MKVAVELGKRTWHPSPLPGQIVLVSTLGPDGQPNVAPKSWISMVAFEGPVLGFGCNETHATCRNAIAQGEFVVNVVPAALGRTVWQLAERHGPERLQMSGLTLVGARVVRPPLVAECHAHLECTLDDVKRYGEEVFLFGRVVAVSVDAELLEGDDAARYGCLEPVFFLESGMFAPLGPSQRTAG